MTPQKIIQGVTGLTRAVTGIGLVEDSVYQSRVNVCRECPLATRNKNEKFLRFKGLTSLSRCELCGCVIHAKARLDDAACPGGKW